VPRAVDEIVSGLLLPDVGVSAEQVVAVLESLLGRPSVAPPSAPPDAEPVTSQVASAPSRERSASPLPAPARQAVASESRAPSWPPLPLGFPASHPPPAGLREPQRRSSLPPAPGPSGSYPPLTLDQSGLGPATDSVAAQLLASTDLEDDETEFRPSLMARLRRMFGRSKPSGGF
jgi:hypothetical protein